MIGTQWWPGLIALALGLIGGCAALFFVGRRGVAERSAGSDARDQLEAKAKALVEQLKELETDKHQYDPAHFAAEKRALEQQAVAAMRDRDAAAKRALLPVESRARPTPTATFGARYPRLIGALWGSGVTAFIALAYVMVSGAGEPPRRVMPVADQNDPRYEAMLVLSAISLSFGDHEQLLQAWEIYMRQPVPRRRPPQLQRAIDWLEKVGNDE